MKKLFVSQPMAGKTDEEILSVRKLAVKQVQERIGEDVEVIDSFFQEHPTFDKPLKYLAASIALLADALCLTFAYPVSFARKNLYQRAKKLGQVRKYGRL